MTEPKTYTWHLPIETNSLFNAVMMVAPGRHDIVQLTGARGPCGVLVSQEHWDQLQKNLAKEKQP